MHSRFVLLLVCGVAFWCIVRPVNGRESSSSLSSSGLGQHPPSISASQKGRKSKKLGSSSSREGKGLETKRRKRRKKRKRHSIDKGEKEDVSDPMSSIAVDDDETDPLTRVAKRKKRKVKKKVVTLPKIGQKAEGDRVLEMPVREEIMKAQVTVPTVKRKRTKKKSKKKRKPKGVYAKLELEKSEKNPKEDCDEGTVKPRPKKRQKRSKRRAFTGSPSLGYGIGEKSAIPTTETFVNSIIDDVKTHVPVLGDENEGNEAEPVEDGFLDRLKVDVSNNEIPPEDQYIVGQSTSSSVSFDTSDEVDLIIESTELDLLADNSESGSNLDQEVVEGDNAVGSENSEVSSPVGIEPSSLEKSQIVSGGERTNGKQGPTVTTSGHGETRTVDSENEEMDNEASEKFQQAPDVYDDASHEEMKKDDINSSGTEASYEETTNNDEAARTDPEPKEGESNPTLTLKEIPSNETTSEDALMTKDCGEGVDTSVALGETLTGEEVYDLTGTSHDGEGSIVDDYIDKDESAVGPTIELLTESSNHTSSDEAREGNATHNAAAEIATSNETSTLNGVSPQLDTVRTKLMNEEIEKDVLGHLAPLSMPEHINRTQNDLIVSVVTWNLAEASPSEKESVFIRNLCKGDRKGSLRSSDFVLIAGQECENIKPRRSEGHRSREFRRLIIQMLGKQYVPIALHMLGGIQFALFCKRKIIGKVQSAALADVTCGIGNVFHNKGAIGCFVKLHPQRGFALSSRLLFVGAHMAAHVKNSEARDADYWRIMSELESQAPGWFMEPNPGGDSNDGTRLQEVADFVVFCGDLNYRIELPREEVENAIQKLAVHNPESDAVSRQRLLKYDQLRASIASEKAFPGFCEGEIKFMPTFKFDKGTNDYDTSKKQRIPAWTDRILYKSKQMVEVVKYDSATNSQHSDHRPVFGTFRIIATTRSESAVDDTLVKKKRRRKMKRSNTRVSDD